jgi:hypothetical protein
MVRAVTAREPCALIVGAEWEGRCGARHVKAGMRNAMPLAMSARIAAQMSSAHKIVCSPSLACGNLRISGRFLAATMA